MIMTHINKINVPPSTRAPVGDGSPHHNVGDPHHRRRRGNSKTPGGARSSICTLSGTDNKSDSTGYNDLKILQWNLNGYFNNQHSLQLLINELNPCIISLQETHLKYNQQTFPPKKYSAFFHNLPTNTTSKQGVCLFVHKSIPHRFIDINSPISAVAVEIELKYKLTIVSLYIPPDQKFDSSELENIITNISTPIILTGDFNSWSPSWGSPTLNSRGKLVENFIANKNLTILNDGRPTHLSTHGSFTHVDLTLSSPHLIPKLVWKVSDDLYGSDHFPILTTLSMETNPKLPKAQPKFLTELAKWDRFQSEITRQNSLRLSFNEVNREAASITKSIRYAANLSIPQTTPQLHNKTVPWWNPNLNSLRQRKQTAFKAFRKSPSESNLITYRKANAEFRRAAKIEKTRCFNKFTSEINQNSSPKKMWCDIRCLTGNYTPHTIKVVKTESSNLTNPIEINSYFAESWENSQSDSYFHPSYLQQKHEYLTTSAPPYTISPSASLIETPITIVELESCLFSAKGKTPGFDRISYEMLKKSPSCLRSKLLSLYNNIFNNGTIPQAWKVATIIPIPKPNKDHSTLSGYRPISLLPCASKILEKIVSKRIFWLIEKNKFIDKNQLAFKKGRSTTDSLIHLDFFISSALSEKNHASILAIDFEQAFDRIGLHVILKQLIEWKIGPKILNYVKAFLSNRKFRIKTNNIYSSIHSLKNGIPQGSPLSVILFIIAFNEINKIVQNYSEINHVLYADDLILFSKCKDLTVLATIFSEIITNLSNWGNISGSKISTSKCGLLHICRKYKCQKCIVGVSLNNIPIKNVSNCKILGILFDSKYSFKDHCTYIKKSLTTRVNIIKYLNSKKSNCNLNTIISIIRSIILSKIDYGLPIYGKCAKSTLQLISTPYHAAIRNSIGAFRTTPIKNILVEAGLPNLTARTEFLTWQILKKVNSPFPTPIHDDTTKILKRKRTPKYLSALQKAIGDAVKLNTPIIIDKKAKSNHPPWNLACESIISIFSDFPKATTNKEIFKTIFLEKSENYKRQGWQLFFSDASKTTDGTSFAVVSENGSIISKGLLHYTSSIFTAEAFAILKAIEAAKNKKTIIFTDSLSSINAIKNINNYSTIAVVIRDKLIAKKKNLRLAWVPGHKDIAGNEIADLEAKQALKEPLIEFYHFNAKDFRKHTKAFMTANLKDYWLGYHHHYSTLNPGADKALYQMDLPASMLKKFIRLRMGHTQITNEHLITKQPAPRCTFCEQKPTFTVTHMLQCAFINRTCINVSGKPLQQLLSSTSPINIKLVHTILIKLNLDQFI